MNIFTNDDYRRIQAWLKANAIKDSDMVQSNNTTPTEDILTIVQKVNGIPTNFKISIKDFLNSGISQIVVDLITSNAVVVNNSLTVDASKVVLNNAKGLTLQAAFDYFENSKLNRHTDDTFDKTLTIGQNLNVGGNTNITGNAKIKGNVTVDSTVNIKANVTIEDQSAIHFNEVDLETSGTGTLEVTGGITTTGEITDGHGNQLNDVNSAAKGWKVEYQNPEANEPTVRAKYVLKDYNGVPKGDTIKIYKDSAITNVYLGTTADTCNEDTGEVTKYPITGNNEALSIVYKLNTGKYSLVNVPLGVFTREAEFDKTRGFGITGNGQVFIKLANDIESSNYLHFNASGEIAADGIESRILRDLGTITSIAGDGTMWGVYKQHEGTSSSTAGDGSRWGAYKTAEAQRSADVTTLKSDMEIVKGKTDNISKEAQQSIDDKKIVITGATDDDVIVEVTENEVNVKNLNVAGRDVLGELDTKLNESDLDKLDEAIATKADDEKVEGIDDRLKQVEDKTFIIDNIERGEGQDSTKEIMIMGGSDDSVLLLDISEQKTFINGLSAEVTNIKNI